MNLAFFKKLIPNYLAKKLTNLRYKYFDVYSIKSYSQEGEDMILRRLLGFKKNGFYVDVGAHHPKRFSNTYYFYKKGWRGINIDAMPGSMNEFDKLRPRDINIEVPISSKKQTLKYYAFNESALNGFSKELSEQRNNSRDYNIIFTKDLQTQTLQNILDVYLPKGQIIDFLSIDVEGLDLDVIKSLDFDKVRPRYILVEVLALSFNDIINNEITNYLTSRSYNIISKTVNTFIFKSNTFKI